MTSVAIDPAQAASVLHRYVDAVTAGDAGRVADLFAADAVFRDPADGAPRHGRDGVRDFFVESFASQGPIRMAIEGEVRVAGPFVAAALTATVPGGDRTVHIDTLDVLRLDGDGLIASLDAYWGPSNIRLLPSMHKTEGA